MDDEKIEVIAPLFDRLIDQDPYTKEEVKVLKNYNMVEMRQSVERDISYLLNTRHSQLPHSMLAYYQALDTEEDARTAPLMSYGLPDFSKYDVSKVSGQVGIETDIKRLIAQYEPRLKDVELHLEITSPPRIRAVLYISGVLTCDPTEERFSFPVDLEHFETYRSTA